MTSGISHQKKFTPSSALTGSLTSKSLTISNTQAGERADYLFKFTSSHGYTVGDKFVITFSSEYDLLVGIASQLSDKTAGKYYISCTSLAMGSTTC